MATFVFLDSSFRDREMFANPADYAVTAAQIGTWFTAPTTVSALAQNPATQSRDFKKTVNVKYVITPYDSDLAAAPVLFLDFHSYRAPPQYMLRTINGHNRNCQFVLVQHKIQNDDIGNPIWIHWEARGAEQTVAFARDDTVVFSLSTATGVPLAIVDNPLPDELDPSKQTRALFEITPYARDNDYRSGLQSFSTP